MQKCFYTFFLVLFFKGMFFSAVQAQTILPTQLPNLVLWLRADSVAKDGSNRVNSWPNYVGGQDFVQADLSKQPLWVDNQWNGKPVIRFDGSDDFLSAGDAYDVGINDRTVFVVAKANGLPYTFYAKQIQDAQPYRLAFGNFNDGNDLFAFFTTPNTPFPNYYPAFYGTNPSGVNIYGNAINRNTQEFKIFLNGGQISNSFTGPGSGLDFDSPYRFLIGAENNATDAGEFRHLNGDIAEMLIYDRALPDNERNQVEYYLREKYSSRVNAGSDISVPYGFCSVPLVEYTGFSSYTWSTGTVNANASVSQSGFYSVSSIDEFGMPTIDTLQVTFASDFSISDTIICGDSVINVGPNLIGPYSYLWSTGESTSFISVDSEGVYTLVVTDNASCLKRDTFVVRIDSLKYRVSLGADTSLCSGNLIGLQTGSDSIISYNWNNAIQTPTILVTDSGYYSLTVSDINGCIATDSIFVDIKGVAPQVAFTDTPVCQGSPMNFRSVTPVPNLPDTLSYFWNFGGGNTNTGQTTSFIFSNPGNINVTLTATSSLGCANSLTRQVTVFENPVAAFSLLSDACVGNQYFFTDSSSPGSGDMIIGYNWLFGDGGSDILKDAAYTYTSVGSKTVTLTVATQKGCLDSFVDTLTVVASAVLPQVPLLSQPTHNSIVSSGLVNFSWFQTTNSSSYTLQVASDSSFNFLVDSVNTTALNYSFNLAHQNYYWRVLANNVCGQDTSSDIRNLSVIDLSSLGSLTLWLMADGQIAKDGSNRVNSWPNYVGGQDFVQADLSKQPLWIDNQWNGKPVIRFDGSDDFLSAGDAYDVGISDRTVFVVAKANGLPYTFYAKQIQDAQPYRLGFGNFNDGNDLFAFFTTPNTPFPNYYPAFYGTNPSGVNIYGNAINRNTQEFKIFLNGGQISNSFTGPGSGLNFDSPYRFLIGAENNATDAGEFRHLNGDIAEFIIYDTALPDGSRNLVEQYLRFKYAPQINLGPDIEIKYGVCDTALKTGPHFSDIQWSTGDTTATIRVNKNGTYWVKAKDVFGYTTSDTVVVNIAYKGPSVGDTLICSGNSLQITQQIAPLSAYIFKWQDGSISNSITASAEGHYSCLITDTVGCTLYSDTVFVNVDSLELFSLLPDSIRLCNGNDFGVLPYEYAYTSYSWKSPVATSSLPTVAVDSSGSYSVIVTDTNQCAAKDTIAVTRSWYAPVTDFTAGNVCLGDSVRFSNPTTANAPDNINSWIWNFGDDSISAVQNPAHIYTSTGDFDVKLFLQTDSGCTGIKRDTVSVYAQPKAIYTWAPQIICAGIPVYFTDTSELTLPDTLTRLWVFNNVDSFTANYPVYTFASQGNVPLTFTVTSNNGCADTISTVFEVFPALIADFIADSVCFGNTTAFTDITASNSIVSWQWNFGDNSFFSAIQNPTHRYQTPKTYNVKLTVTNAIGCVSTVSDSVKIASIPLALFTDSNACEGYLYSPKDNSISLNDSIKRWDWNIGSTLYPNTYSPQRLFPVAGNYPVTLSVTTASGCKNSVTRFVTINPNPTALFGFTPLYGEAPLDVTFNNLSVNAGSYLWSFGDNTSSTDRNPTHTYLQNGTYDITLTAVSDSGCFSSYTQSFIVIPTELDLSLDVVDATQTPLTGGYVSVRITVTMSNRGTRIITTSKLYAILGSGGVITEEYDSVLYPGQTINYVFTAQFVATTADANTYICVNAGSVNGGETEIRTDNNRACTSMSDTIQLVGPTPNPVYDRSVLGIILPKAGKVYVAIIDAIGKYVLNETELSLPSGRSDFEIPAHQMNAAEYFIRVRYNDDKFIRKFVVER